MPDPRLAGGEKKERDCTHMQTLSCKIHNEKYRNKCVSLLSINHVYFENKNVVFITLAQSVKCILTIVNIISIYEALFISTHILNNFKKNFVN